MAWELGQVLKVENAVAGVPYNYSYIGHNAAKLQSRPPGVHVVGCREKYSHDETLAWITYDSPWSVLPEFIRWALGFTTSILSPGSGAGIGQLSRILPDQHPEMPWLYADDLSMQGGMGILTPDLDSYAQDSDGSRLIVEGTSVLLPNVYYADNQGTRLRDGLARVEVLYRALPYEIRTDAETYAAPLKELTRYVERKPTYAIQAQQIPTTQVRFLTTAESLEGAPSPYGGGLIPEAGVLVTSTQGLTYKWHKVPDIPETAIDACVGTVNTFAFDGLAGFGPYPAGHLLCQPPRVMRTRNCVGRVTWDIEYNFLFRPDAPWNTFPASDGMYYPVTFGGTSTGRKVYSETDFNLLFVAPEPRAYR